MRLTADACPLSFALTRGGPVAYQFRHCCRAWLTALARGGATTTTVTETVDEEVDVVERTVGESHFEHRHTEVHVTRATDKLGAWNTPAVRTRVEALYEKQAAGGDCVYPAPRTGDGGDFFEFASGW